MYYINYFISLSLYHLDDNMFENQTYKYLRLKIK